VRGRFNLFQASMLRWRALHPYNAVHVMTLPGAPDFAKLSGAIGGTLAEWGLTGLEIDAARGRYEYRGGPAQVEVRAVDAPGEDGNLVLEREVERELNHRYPASGPIEPFRFFAIPGDGSFRLGLGYDHFVAAGDSIVTLMRAIERACREGRVDRAGPVERYPERCGSMLLRQAGALARGAGAAKAMADSCRRSVRPRYPRGKDGRNGFVLASLDVPEVARLRESARRLSVKLNDLLLAAALFAVAPFTGARDPAKQRHEIGVASIVNIRREFRGADHAFGQFLSSFRISHPMPPDATLASVAADVRTQTDAIKRRKLHLQTLVAMGASGTFWRFMNDHQRRTMHSRTYPTWIGVSNLDVDALWRTDGGGPAPDYVRAVPTGPLSPVVVAPSTAGGRMHLGFSFRTTAFERDDIARMASLFTELCRQPPG
jgi:hypothetical protein